MSERLRGEDLRGSSAVTSCVRFAERMADKLAAGRVPLALDRRETAWERLAPQEAAERDAGVWAAVRAGASVAVACQRAGVTATGFRSWAYRHHGGLGRKRKS